MNAARDDATGSAGAGGALGVVLVGDLVQLWPDAHRYGVADVYWRDERSLTLVTGDGRVIYTRPDRVHVVEPRREVTP